MNDKNAQPQIIVVQPVVPSYRLGFFERLVDEFGERFVVYASQLEMGVLTDGHQLNRWERRLGPIKPFFLGLDWQTGAVSIPIQRGDVIVIWGSARCLSNIVLLAKAKARGARVVWWGHYWSSTSSKLGSRTRRWLMRFADAVLFYTDEEVCRYNLDQEDTPRFVFALNNGIETADIVRLRKPFDAASRAPRLLFIGRLTPKSGLDILLNAVAQTECASISLDIIGAGPLEERLQELARQLGIQNRVHWHGATTDEERIASIANACRAFVYPGAVGLSLIHGLSYGLPAIIHDDRLKHMPEFSALNPSVNGITFRSGDAESLASAISNLIFDNRRLNSMSISAVRTTEDSFNAASMCQRFCAVVRAISPVRPNYASEEGRTNN